MMNENYSKIENVKIVLPENVIENGTIVIEDGTIKEIIIHDSNKENKLILMPGFIDIHNDSLERAIAPRSGVPFPLPVILREFDSELAVHGITTVYHCVAFAEMGEMTNPLRFRKKALEILNEINSLKKYFKINTLIHLRYEILDVVSLPEITSLVKNNEINFLSLMDHTPGFGAFSDFENYRKYVTRSGLSAHDAEKTYNERINLRKKLNMKDIKNLVKLCIEKNIPVATHDDHTAEKIDWSVENNIGIAEFPTTNVALDYAREKGLFTVFGASNLVRGGSHVGNLSAMDVLENYGK